MLPRRDLGGCEPYFSHDGRWGYWMPGAGGPIDRIDLATGEVSTLVHKNDPRLGERGYLYFPMVSRDGRLLAFGASAGEHDHFRSDYDIFVFPTDPETLEIVGPPIRLTDDPATDRYPDVFLDRPSPAYEAALRAAATPAAWQPAERLREGLPRARAGRRRADRLVFLWQTGDRPNLVAADRPGRRRAGGTRRSAPSPSSRGAGPGSTTPSAWCSTGARSWRRPRPPRPGWTRRSPPTS